MTALTLRRDHKQPPAARPAIADLNEARLAKLLARQADDERRLAVTKAEIAAFCRQWGDARGYKVKLDEFQILRELEAGRAR